jgi:transporter family protein
MSTNPLSSAWLVWAGLSACFAALTAILAKLGVEQVNPDVATLIRTVVVLIMLGAIVAATGQYRLVAATPARSILFLIFSGLATGASWLCYFRALHVGDAARVAPIDKLSVVLVAVFASLFLGERLSGLNWIGIVLIAAGAWLVTVRP